MMPTTVCALLAGVLVFGAPGQRGNPDAANNVAPAIAVASRANTTTDGRPGVEITNTGQRDIIAWSVSVTVIGADGRTQTFGYFDDMLQAEVIRRHFPASRFPENAGKLSRGTTRVVPIHIPDSGSNDVSARVDLVIFDDGTSVGNPAKAAVALKGRQNLVNSIERWLPVLQRAQAATPEARAETLRREWHAMSTPTPQKGDKPMSDLIAQAIEHEDRTPGHITDELIVLIDYLTDLSTQARRQVPRPMPVR
jgi:hypothetical protein